MLWITRFLDKTGALGAIVAAMGCAACFPALGSLAASLGLGFLAQYEGLFVNTLLPFFAIMVIFINGLYFLSHHRWGRLLIGVVGPGMVLLTLYPLWTYAWSTWLFYAGLFVMFVVAIWDIVSPPVKRCTVDRQHDGLSGSHHD